MFSKKSYHLENSMQSLIKTAQFQDKFEIPRLNQSDQSLQSAVLDLLNISEDLDKLGSQNLSKQILKIAHDIMGDEESEMEELPPNYEACKLCGFDHEHDANHPGVQEEIEKAHANWPSDADIPEDYEVCGTCGYDHDYDGENSIVLKEINRRHLEAGDKPNRPLTSDDVGKAYHEYEDANLADDSGKSKIEKEIHKHLKKIEEEMKECEYAISTFDYKEDDEISKKDFDKLQKAFNEMGKQKNKMLDVLDQFEEKAKEKESEKSDKDSKDLKESE